MMKIGDKVECNGFNGTVVEIHAWANNDLISVKLPGGVTCVGASELKQLKG